MPTTIRLPVEDHTLTRKTILVVEDDPSDAELTLLALRRSNISNKVILARDGAEALEFLRGCAEPGGPEHAHEQLPAVVLLDLKLPSISGLDVLRQIRSDPRTKTVPVVILTSSKEENDVVEGYELGANSFICKPVDFEKFTQAVGTLGLYWVLMNEAPSKAEAGREFQNPRHPTPDAGLMPVKPMQGGL